VQEKEIEKEIEKEKKKRVREIGCITSSVL
jgi:hypothetical protein